MADATYEPKVYIEQGAERQVIKSGGSLDVESGGELDFESGASLKIAGTAITSSAAELNKLNGVTASTAELNKLVGVTATPAELNKTDASAMVEVVSDGTRVLTSADDGMTFIATAAGGVVFTLPATVAGLKFTFVAKVLSSGTGLSLSPNSADKINAEADDADWINTEATDVVGDSCTVVGDGVDGWYTTAQVGLWAA